MTPDMAPITPATMARLPDLPPVIARPKWAYFMWSRGLGIEEVAPLLGRSREYVRQLGLPWGHKKRQAPTEDEVAFIAAWSRGEVTAADWSEPEPAQGPAGEVRQ